MTKKPKLSHIQLVLLSSASQREDGNLFPTAESQKGAKSRITKAIESLIKVGFAAEGEVGPKVPSWRDDAHRRLGVAITAQGRAAIGTGAPVEGKKGKKAAEPEAAPEAAAPAPHKPGEIRAGTKQALLVGMLEREDGASIQQIVEATGWLPHTTRAALTGLKKRGFEISSQKVEGVGRYHALRAG